ncbi:tannase/feruloyl esterase family alpha/beta hydrolase [Azohydromonas caseinilytica]|uniref:tannase/feruloyl esterase family alpha/beta hydrolase n=1 Tax=Azohydromonas caseinilytica TaxID=2728836 RepID=UPI001F35AA5C|nr:tannase/feruloyl esterase family alpha/beta hydrolase [Azohydromonas caseinilytica]
MPALLLGGALCACAGPGTAPAPGPAPEPVSGGGCARVQGLRLAPEDIGLQTRGAAVTRAAPAAAQEPGFGRFEYCALQGEIFPVDAQAPPIRFQVNLPQRWNGKAVHMGGSGFNGTVITGTGPINMALFTSPLARGYATFGSDAGHPATAAGADFALNDEALLNFAWQHLKKTHDVALQLIRRHYDQPPRRLYFAGASTGGREAFTAIQRFPADYDGIVATAPALNFAGLRLMGVRLGQASYRVPGGFLPPAKQVLVRDTALRSCDPLDGLTDGVVAAIDACRQRAPALLAALRCPGGQDAGAHCLSDAQIATVRLLHEGFSFGPYLAHGQTGYDGYNVLAGTDFSGSLGLGNSPVPAKPPSIAANGYLFATGDAYMKYFIARDPSYDALNFDFANPGPLRARINALSAVVGAIDPELRPFAARGGKVILAHGLADEVVSPNQTIGYYRSQVEQRGQAAVDAFMRFYTVPGFQHGGGTFIPFWDLLGALDRWVEQGMAPETLVATDVSAGANGRQRPICRYPFIARYKGSGDPQRADSFNCSH